MAKDYQISTVVLTFILITAVTAFVLLFNTQSLFQITGAATISKLNQTAFSISIASLFLLLVISVYLIYSRHRQ
jgi:hypothetical protein